MNEVKATTMATEIAKQHNITRAAAFDMVLAVAVELEIKGTRFTAKQAAEIEAAISRSAQAGDTITLNRPTIGA
jgi:hypothetical protein